MDTGVDGVYAIIQDSGKQYRVREGDKILVDRKNLGEGDTIDFNEVLFCDGKIGTPYLDGVQVTGIVRSHVKGVKIYVQKFKRRKKYRRRTGHRQKYTTVEITGIGS